MSNKLYKEDTKKKKKKETEIGTFMGRIIYGCTLSLIAILLLIAFFVPSNINEPRAFTGFVIMIIVLSIFAAYGIGLTLLSKHSIKFKDWFEKDMMKLYNLTPPEDINNTERFVIYRPNFYKGGSIVTVLVFLGFLIMTIVVADNRPDLYLFWVGWLVVSVISAIHTCTYKYTIENRKIRYKWLFGKEKVIAFSEIDKITLEGSPNSECGVIYKKGVKKPFMKIRMIDKNANRFRYLNIK